MNFKQIIELDRKKINVENFEYTLLEYLEIVKNNPETCKLAHKRIYDIIMEKGVNEEGKKYNFFDNNFFGIDNTLTKIMNYFYSASMKGEEARQVLYLVGPVGSGKSSIIESIKKGLEESEPIYFIKGCPMREEPLHLIPKHLRGDFERILGVRIEGELCPICRYRLKEEYGGEFEKFKIEKLNFSIRERKGIGVVPPVDPNNQDASVLVGSVDISKMDLYPEDDPRIFSLNGAFNIGNRGMVEFIEVFKNDVEYLHSIITATQEKSIPSPGKAAMIYFDGVIIAHSNEAEWKKFKGDHTNEAILDRIVKVEVPYCLEVKEEKKIYEKILSASNFKIHIAPHTLDIAAMFAILTRLVSSPKVDLFTKLKIYNGEDIIEKGTSKKIDILELKEEAGNKEGMSGISTRFIIKAIDNAICECREGCINPINIIESLTNAIKDLDVSEEEKDKYLSLIQDVIRKEYNKILEKEITRSFIYGFKEGAEALFNNYLDNAEAFVNNDGIKEKLSGDILEPDEKFMRNIEEQIGISEAASKGFRNDLISYMTYLMRNGEKIDYTCYEPLREAIEKKLAFSAREVSRIITKSRVRNKEQNEKYNRMAEQMEEHGYCCKCCEKLLNYAANNLWKD